MTRFFELYRRGDTPVEIARELGIPQARVEGASARVRAAETRGRQHQTVRVERDVAILLERSALTGRQIARRMGFSLDELRELARRLYQAGIIKARALPADLSDCAPARDWLTATGNGGHGLTQEQLDTAVVEMSEGVEPLSDREIADLLGLPKHRLGAITRRLTDEGRLHRRRRSREKRLLDEEQTRLAYKRVKSGERAEEVASDLSVSLRLLHTRFAEYALKLGRTDPKDCIDALRSAEAENGGRRVSWRRYRELAQGHPGWPGPSTIIRELDASDWPDAQRKANVQYAG